MPQIPAVTSPLLETGQAPNATRPATLADIQACTMNRIWYRYFQTMLAGHDQNTSDANSALLFSATSTGGAGGTGGPTTGSDIAPNNITLPDDDGAGPIVGTLNWTQSRNIYDPISLQISHNNATRTLSLNELIAGGAGSAVFQMVGGTRGTFVVRTTTSFVQISTSINTWFWSVGSGATLGYIGTNFRRGSSDPCILGDADNGFNGLYLAYTNTAAVGAVVINDPSGRVNVAAGIAAITVTNLLVKAKSHVFAQASQNDATGQVLNTVCAAGSFTINLIPPTAQMSVDFVVIGAN